MRLVAYFLAIVVAAGLAAFPATAKRSAEPFLVNPPSASELASLPEYNKKLVDFALNHIGKKVDDGECAMLVQTALDEIGARENEGYVWGQLVDPKEAYLPGDIIQFTSAYFRWTTPDGHWHEVNVGAPGHTAIIYNANHGQLLLLEQNGMRGRMVQTNSLDLHNLIRGSYKVYRPLPPLAKKEEPQEAAAPQEAAEQPPPQPEPEPEPVTAKQIKALIDLKDYFGSSTISLKEVRVEPKKKTAWIVVSVDSFDTKRELKTAALVWAGSVMGGTNYAIDTLKVQYRSSKNQNDYAEMVVTQRQAEDFQTPATDMPRLLRSVNFISNVIAEDN